MLLVTQFTALNLVFSVLTTANDTRLASGAAMIGPEAAEAVDPNRTNQKRHAPHRFAAVRRQQSGGDTADPGDAAVEPQQHDRAEADERAARKRRQRRKILH